MLNKMIFSYFQLFEAYTIPLLRTTNFKVKILGFHPKHPIHLKLVRLIFIKESILQNVSVSQMSVVTVQIPTYQQNVTE